MPASPVLRESTQGRKQMDEIQKTKRKLAAARDRLLSEAEGLDKEGC